MSLFQSIVTEKYVRELDNAQLETAWQTFSHCFLNLSKQDNIRLSKEEQYQEGFLRDLFVDVFGYTLNPNPDYDITTEFKNQTGSKKADGAILKDGHAIGVIELKGMNTTDLSKIEQQAFGYKNNQPKCRYVITSNFQKLRLYIDNAVEFIEFNLFTLTQDDFALLYLLLHRDGIMGDLPAKLKSASLSQEEAITKQLYKDYSVFKRELFNDLITNNPSVDNLVLFQKSQKLLDRLLFIFFAEDSHLLPANFAKGIISEWEQLKSLKMTVPLYDRVKAYFGYLDKGHKDEHSEIFAYNGGLFSTDELLDSVIISDNILYTHIKILSEYDFDSEVDVNILGHIFENSLSELDEVKAQLEGTAVDKSQTKRKKDGVFYTPKYITKYIVENTVGKLCTDKKLELGINEEDYQQEAVINKDGTKRKKTDKQIAKEKVAFDNLNAYRDWLLQITICDPAAGSGAFLNEALNFLIAEHEYIVELETKLFGSGLAYPDIENSILENNLFGVDINEESVEIAKLSLWLRTAQPRRKLNNLNDNIKCGNSLIDDPAVAGDKAFNWQTAFPQVFAKGGFDVVIGNPPYGAHLSTEDKKFLKVKYSTVDSSTPNTYAYFIGLSLEISNLVGFIIPDSYLLKDYQVLRTRLKSHIKNLVWYQNTSMPDEIKPFPDVEHDVTTIIVNMNEKYDVLEYSTIIYNDYNLKEIKISREITDICDEDYFNIYNLLINEIETNLKNRLKGFKSLYNFTQIHEGIHTGNIRDKLFVKDSPDLKPVFVGGRSGDYIDNYYSRRNNWFVNYDKTVIDKDNNEYASLRDETIFNNPKVYITRTGNPFKCFIDIDNYASNNFFSLQTKDIEDNNTKILSFYVCLLNSKFSQFYIRKIIAPRIGDTFVETKIIHLLKIPCVKIDIDNEGVKFENIVDKMVSLKKENIVLSGKFIRTLQRKFEINKLSKKLENWHELTYAEFIKELGKKKIKMGLGDEAEWEEYFLAEKTKAQQLIAEIERTDREIDQMVYKLYDLTHDEIAIIEAS